MSFRPNPADELLEAVNKGVDVPAFGRDIKEGHSHLQAELMNQIVRPMVVALAEVEYTDRRNAKAVDDARRIADEMGWEYSE